MKLFTTKRLCRAGVIAALYVALTYAFSPLAFDGILQIRPAEALCILPLFFPEAVPALYIGCMLSNLASPFLVYDVFLGSLATLLAATGTYFAGKLIKQTALRIAIGGLFPVLINAFFIPVIIVFLCDGAEVGQTLFVAYWVNFASMVVTEALWVYALGIPLYLFVDRMRKKNVSAFLDGKHLPQTQPDRQPTHS